MKHNQQPVSSQRQVVVSPQPLPPCSPPTQRASIYQLTPAAQDLMAPKSHLPLALEAMSNIWIPQDLRQRESVLPVIEGPQGAIRGGETRQKRHQYIAMVPPFKASAKKNYGIRCCFSDSFNIRIEPLYDGLDAGAPFRGLVPTTQNGRRPSTPIVESATKAGIRARMQQCFSSTDPARTQNDDKRIPVGRSDSSKKQPNRTKCHNSPSKGDTYLKDSDMKDAVKEIANGSYRVWREKTRSLRRASEMSSTTELGAPVVDDDTVKISNKEERDKVRKQEEVVIKHRNYCSSRKTNQVVKWLREVNLQDSFEIIE